MGVTEHFLLKQNYWFFHVFFFESTFLFSNVNSSSFQLHSSLWSTVKNIFVDGCAPEQKYLQASGIRKTRRQKWPYSARLDCRRTVWLKCCGAWWAWPVPRYSRIMKYLVASKNILGTLSLESFYNYVLLLNDILN